MEHVKLQNLVFFILLVSNITKMHTLESSNSSAKTSIEDPITAEDDSAQELSSQLQDVGTRSNGWSDWSSWSPCSRSCDGGVSHQFRTCESGSCKGEHVRRSICNMQPCPEPRDYRNQQCAAFNDKPYGGTYYQWTPHYDDGNDCNLICRGKPPYRGSEESTEEPSFIVAQLAEKVHDGTRCRPGSLDMCIDGKCQKVGCDLRIGSLKQVDACGVCGGDGSSCARPLYHWILTPMSLCSVTCGGGYKMSRPLCQNRVTGEEVEEKLCNEAQKLESTILPCNKHNCPPKWHTGDWGACSVSCGGGSRIRQVYCVEEANSTRIRVNEMKCMGHKPRFQEACNQFDCPTWHSSSWSGCSVSCGEGVQIRGVECRDHTDSTSTECDPLLKPDDKMPCSTGIQCPTSLTAAASSEEFPQNFHTQPLIEPYPPLPASPEKLIGGPVVPSESTFVPDEWGPCSVTCGEGIRKREVRCKIYLEMTKTIAVLPDYKCATPKPIETEKCHRPCVAMEAKDDPYRSANSKLVSGISYSWKEQGYTQCSATCLGGMQELIVNCVRDDTQKVTYPHLCPPEKKPEIIMRTCNDHPCPPKWNYSEFSPCTQSCGIGLQTRDVHCVHESGGGNVIIVPHNMCPQPPPLDRQHCNILDCPVRWVTSEWSKCSKSCDGGEKTRKVECKQVMAQNHTVSRPARMCPTPKPADRKPCNTKSCMVETEKPKIFSANNTFIQNNVKQKKITLTVGGAATVFFGTTLKIKCPVKRFDKSKISWVKDKNPLPKSKKFKTSKKGALRIQNATLRESGAYMCIAGKSSAKIQISVRPKPGEFPTSEEIQRQSYKHDKVKLTQGHRDDGVVFSIDDHSHEQRPDKPKKKMKSTTSTPFYPTQTLESNINHLNAWPPQMTTKSVDNDQDRLISSYTPSSTFENSSSSSASSVKPHFQIFFYSLQLLWPFSNHYANSRGHRMITLSEENYPKDHANVGELISANNPEDLDREIVLGHGAEYLRFEWDFGEWSRCSETCGETGLQTRDARCVVKLHNATQAVNDHLCEMLEPPDTVRKCNRDSCPKWKTTEWSDCKRSKCFSLHRGLQRRTVKCYSSANTTLHASKCDANQKPSQHQECYNERCIGKWKAGAWSEFQIATTTQHPVSV